MKMYRNALFSLEMYVSCR